MSLDFNGRRKAGTVKAAAFRESGCVRDCELIQKVGLPEFLLCIPSLRNDTHLQNNQVVMSP